MKHKVLNFISKPKSAQYARGNSIFRGIVFFCFCCFEKNQIPEMCTTGSLFKILEMCTTSSLFEISEMCTTGNSLKVLKYAHQI